MKSTKTSPICGKNTEIWIYVEQQYEALVEADFQLIKLQVPEGHKRMIMEAVSRMSRTSPQSNKTKQKNTPTVGESPESKSHCAESSKARSLRSPRPRNFPGADLTKK